MEDRIYVSPVIDIIEINLEKGFAQSTGDESFNDGGDF